jgi:glycosyltransferase involved in cell wall biosynthesis
MQPADILTDLPAPPGSFWGDHTRFVGPADPPRWLARVLGQRWAYNLIRIVNAFRLLAKRRRCQGVVSGGGANGLLFAWLQGLVPWGRKPHVLIDCNWDLPRGAFWGWLKGLRIRWAARAVHRFVVWASHEIDDYAEAFGVARDRFVYVPFHGTAHNYEYTVRDEGYLFAGGNYDRDYRTLVEAVRPLALPVWIATTRGDPLLRGMEIPPQVRVEGTTAAGFRQAMAAARLVVVPMEKGLLHSGGQQTLLNAMLMGKPTIAVGRKWAVDFVEDGVNGLIVDYEDVSGLRRAVEQILTDPVRAKAMAERGQADAAQFTTQRTMQTVYDLVRQAAASPRTRKQEEPRHVAATGNLG